MTARKATHNIATSHSRKPIPTDRLDWMASFADDEPNDDGQMLIGFGATEIDAIDDLLDQCDRPYSIITRNCS